MVAAGGKRGSVGSRKMSKLCWVLVFIGFGPMPIEKASQQTVRLPLSYSPPRVNFFPIITTALQTLFA